MLDHQRDFRKAERNDLHQRGIGQAISSSHQDARRCGKKPLTRKLENSDQTDAVRQKIQGGTDTGQSFQALEWIILLH